MELRRFGCRLTISYAVFVDDSSVSPSALERFFQSRSIGISLGGVNRKAPTSLPKINRNSAICTYQRPVLPNG